MYCAARNGSASIMIELLNFPGIDINIVCKDNLSTPLHGMNLFTTYIIIFINEFSRKFCVFTFTIYAPLNFLFKLLAAGFADKPELVALLLARGADYDKKNSLGLSAKQEAQGESQVIYSLFLNVCIFYIFMKLKKNKITKIRRRNMRHERKELLLWNFFFSLLSFFFTFFFL